MLVRIGVCSLCGGPASFASRWRGSMPPARCEVCGATESQPTRSETNGVIRITEIIDPAHTPGWQSHVVAMNPTLPQEWPQQRVRFPWDA